MEPHSPRSQLYSHSALGRALFFSFLSTASALAISGLAFLASKTCLGSKLPLTTVALFAIDISIPDVSASQWLHPWGHRITLFTEAIPWPGTAWLACVTRYPIRQSFWYQYPRIMDTYLPITSQLRILSHLYPLPDLTKREWFTSFLCSSLHIQTNPSHKRNGGKMGTTYHLQAWNVFMFCP